MIHKIKLENWRSHEDTELEFSQGTNALLGIMGSGKSSVLQALVFALYGDLPELRERKMKLEDLIMFKPKQKQFARVTLTFAAKGKWWTVSRKIGLDEGTTAELRCDGKLVEAGPVKVTDTIIDLLNVDFELFSRAVYAKQNEIDYFLTLPKGKRMEKIDELLKLDKLEASRVSLSSEVSKLRGSVDALDSILRQSNKDELVRQRAQVLEEERKMLEELGRGEPRCRNLEEQLGQLEKKLSSLVQKKKEKERFDKAVYNSEQKKLELEEKIQSLQQYSSISEPEKKLDELSRKKKEAESSLKLRSSLSGEQKTLQKRVPELEQRISTLSALGSREVLLKEREKLESLVGKVRDDIERLNSQLVSNRADQIRFELDSMEKEYSQVNTKIQSLTHAVQSVEERAKLLDLKIVDVEESFEELGRRRSVGLGVPDAKSKAKNADAVLRSEIEGYVSVKPLKDQVKELLQKESELKDRMKTKKDEWNEEKKKHDRIKHDLDSMKKDHENLSKTLMELVRKLEKLDELGRVQEEYSKTRNRLEEISLQLQGMAEIDLSSIDNEIEKMRMAREFQQVNKTLVEVKDNLILMQSKTASLDFDEQEYDKQQKDKENIISELSKYKGGLSGLKALADEKKKSIVRIEEQLSQRESHERELSRSRKIVQNAQILLNALKDAQTILRIEFMNTVNVAMTSLWEILYPYNDFAQLRMAIQSEGMKRGDYSLELQDRMGKWLSVDTVSGGERSMACLALRIAFAKVLVPNFRLLVLDEPTHNLDVQGVEELGTALRERVSDLVDQVLVITHDERLEKAVTGNCYRLARDKSKDEPTRVLGV